MAPVTDSEELLEEKRLNAEVSAALLILRVNKIEEALVKISNFTDKEILPWKSEVNANLYWIKLLLAAGVFSGVITAVAQVIAAFKGAPQ